MAWDSVSEKRRRRWNENRLPATVSYRIRRTAGRRRRGWARGDSGRGMGDAADNLVVVLISNAHKRAADSVLAGQEGKFLRNLSTRLCSERAQ